MQKMLYITTQLPCPPVSGGVIKSWRMINHYSKLYELSLFCFFKGKDIQWKGQFERRINLKDFRYQEFEIRRSYKALVNSYFTNKSLNLYRNYSSEAKKTIEEMLKGIDILFVDHYEMFQYVPKNFEGKVVLHQHNAEFVLWNRFAKIEKSVIKRNFLYLESKRIQRAEKEYCKRADLVLAAPNDIDQLMSLGIIKTKFRETYHLGEDDLLLEETIKFEDTEKVIMFLGTLNWEANVDGLIHFMDEVFPEILKKEPDTKLYIIGKDADNRIVSRCENHDNILLTGFVENVEPFYKKARVFILPMRFGSGIKVKFLNALYRGIPTVSTDIGAEGLEVEHENEVLIANTDEEFTSQTLELLKNKTLWAKIQNQGRALAQEKYLWKNHLSKLEGYLKEL
tara:strand:+ start:121 stop:1308 length:1188 start_codon:yes stop_codon:yes gene_type:complete